MQFSALYNFYCRISLRVEVMWPECAVSLTFHEILLLSACFSPSIIRLELQFIHQNVCKSVLFQTKNLTTYIIWMTSLRVQRVTWNSLLFGMEEFLKWPVLKLPLCCHLWHPDSTLLCSSKSSDTNGVRMFKIRHTVLRLWQTDCGKKPQSVFVSTLSPFF